MTAAATATGVILWTAAGMSSEQATGQPTDTATLVVTVNGFGTLDRISATGRLAHPFPADSTFEHHPGTWWY